MSSFGLFSRTGAAKFKTDRIDLNIWALPSVVSRGLFLVDFGVRLTLEENAGSGRPVAFRVGLPFAVLDKSEKVRDLVPALVNDNAMCALVFGASDLSIEVKQNEGWKSGTWLEDGETTDSAGNTVSDRMLFVRLEQDKCSEVERTQDGRYSLWEISAGDREVHSGTSIYLRFRFATRRPGRIWDWQGGVRSNAHAISDLRVSEFRERPLLQNPPNYSTDVLDADRVNGFVILPSSLKAGRVSPQPKYVRVLENGSWEKYLGRRLGRTGEHFLITYWTKEGVTQGSPFRSFLEVERRRPTAVRAVTIATLVLIVAMGLTQPWWLLRESSGGRVVRDAWGLILPVVSGLTILGVLRAIWGQLWRGKDSLKRVRAFMERVDARRFRLPR